MSGPPPRPPYAGPPGAGGRGAGEQDGAGRQRGAPKRSGGPAEERPRTRWGKDAAKYLLPGEQPVISTRRHWAVLARPAVRGVPALVVGGLILQADPTNQVTSTVGLLVVLGAAVYLGLHVAEWWVRHLLITKRRVLLTSGVIIRTVAVMPLRRITDLTWKETLVGQVLGYGTFRFESAGQQQGLDVITYIPDADELYRKLSGLMFSTDYAKGGGDEDDGTGSTDDGGSGRDRSRGRAEPPRPGDTNPIPRVSPPPDGDG